MYLDCTECGTHVYTHISDHALACMDLTEAVYCDACQGD